MPITLNGDTGIQTPMYNGTITANAVTPSVNMKNRIINGAMQIDQRNAGASVTISSTTALTYVVDRWSGYGTVGSRFSLQQNAGSVTPPTGFKNYLGATSLTATSLAAGDYYVIQQRIEGFNIADLDWGTANAKTVTLSFWVRSSLTGTFGGSITNGNDNRSYPFTYTISAANTWEQKSITIAGDTTGTWATDNSSGIKLYFSLGTGSTLSSSSANSWQGGVFTSATGATSVVGTNGATFYITGVQLEVGSTATSFDYRPYGTELQLCERYYQIISLGGAAIAAASTTSIGFGCSFRQPMRATPSQAFNSSTASHYNLFRPGLEAAWSTSTLGLNSSTNLNAVFEMAGYTGLSNNQSWVFRYSQATFKLDAEL